VALVVEDGTGMDDAEAYVSVADCATYHTAMGNTWTGTVAAKEAALRRATQYIDAMYRFRGYPENESQALAWPRYDYTWPVKAVTDATCELALRALSGALYADEDAAVVESEKVGPIEVKYARNMGQKRYRLVDDLLSAYVIGGRGQSRLVRA
jgi:hypothetical protein